MKRKHMPGCGCCCSCSPLGLHLDLDELGGVSIPFEEGVTHYEGSTTLAGSFNNLCDIRTYKTELSCIGVDCSIIGQPPNLKVAASTLTNFVNWYYRRLTERILIEYDLDYDKSTCRLTGTVLVRAYIDNFYKHSPTIPTAPVAVHSKHHHKNPNCVLDIPTFQRLYEACDFTSITELCPLDYEVGDDSCCDGAMGGVPTTSITETETFNPLDFDQPEHLLSSTLLCGAAITINKNLCDTTENVVDTSGTSISYLPVTKTCTVSGHEYDRQTCEPLTIDCDMPEVKLSLYYEED